MPLTLTREIEPKFEESSYRKTRLGNLLRAVYGGVANNPTKAMTFLVLDKYPRHASVLLEDLYKGCFGVMKRTDLKEIGIRGIYHYGSYLESAILSLSNFAGKEERVIKKTGLAEQRALRYYKTNDGFIIADVPAVRCIAASSHQNTVTSDYITRGTAQTSGETDSPTLTSLILSYLVEEVGLGKSKSLHEIVDEFFEFRGSHSSTEYSILNKKLSMHILPRLKRTKLINYEFMNTAKGEHIIHSTNATPIDTHEPEIIDKLKDLHLSQSTLNHYDTYAMSTISSIREGKTTADEIANHLGLTRRQNISRTLSLLRKVGLVNIVSGKTGEELSTIELLDRGKQYYEKFLKSDLKNFGLFEATERVGGIKYKIVDEMVEPDLNECYEERKRIVDPIINNIEWGRKFIEHCREARRRHQSESGGIRKYTSLN